MKFGLVIARIEATFDLRPTTLILDAARGRKDLGYSLWHDFYTTSISHCNFKMEDGLNGSLTNFCLYNPLKLTRNTPNSLRYIYRNYFIYNLAIWYSLRACCSTVNIKPKTKINIMNCTTVYIDINTDSLCPGNAVLEMRMSVCTVS